MRLVLVLLIVAVPLVGLGALAIRANRREHRRIAERRALLDGVPREWQFRAAPWWAQVGALLALIGAAAAIGVDAIAAALAAGLIGAALCAWILRERSRHKRAVIAAVRAHAPSMSTAEARQLIAGLEVSYDDRLRELRDLAGPDL
ncbi:MAG: hypothetical protein JHC95_05530 [Solirubrobacteraceae bacterium]|nr:hypothetical protein [Solirubrobacteraceae bacterium]